MKRKLNNKAAELLIIASLVSLPFTKIQTVSAIEGNVEIILNQTEYNKGDTVTAEVKIKSTDGSNFLLQTNLNTTTGLSVSSATGDNISYNNGKIVGTAPQSEFIINVVMTVNSDVAQSISLSNTKFGAVDGSPNHTIARIEKDISIVTPTEPIVTEPTNEEEYSEDEINRTENSTEDNVEYEPWKGTVMWTNHLNVREGPGFTYKIISSLSQGAQVTIRNEKKVIDTTWVDIGFGWCSKDYVLPGENLIPELDESAYDDDAIEKQQQDAIKQEAQQTENQNQETNNSALESDNNKKDNYDRQEQNEFNESTIDTAMESIPEPTSTEEPIIETTSATEPSESLPVQDTYDKEFEEMRKVFSANLGHLDECEDSSYMAYTAPNMTQPFYLYIESYSLTFPDDYQTIPQGIGGLEFTVAIPKDVSRRENNVFLAYGTFKLGDEPKLYLFDKTANNFFEYEKIHETVVEKEVHIANNKLGWPSVLIGLLTLVGSYAIGTIVTSSRLITIAKTKRGFFGDKRPSINSETETNSINMSDEEFDKLMSEYEAQSTTPEITGQFRVDDTDTSEENITLSQDNQTTNIDWLPNEYSSIDNAPNPDSDDNKTESELQQETKSQPGSLIDEIMESVQKEAEVASGEDKGPERIGALQQTEHNDINTDIDIDNESTEEDELLDDDNNGYIGKYIPQLDSHTEDNDIAANIEFPLDTEQDERDCQNEERLSKLDLKFDEALTSLQKEVNLPDITIPPVVDDVDEDFIQNIQLDFRPPTNNANINDLDQEES